MRRELVPEIGQDRSSGAATLEFRIEGEIKGAMLHGRRSRKFPDDDRLWDWRLVNFKENNIDHCIPNKKAPRLVPQRFTSILESDH
jgi:hypothetical protein